LPRESPERRERLPDLALALDDAGRFDRLIEVVEEAIDVGRSTGDAVLLHRGLVEWAVFLLLHQPKRMSLEEHRAVAEEAVAVLSEHGHDAGLTGALDLLGLVSGAPARWRRSWRPRSVRSSWSSAARRSV
jgi:hypothetical protein